MKGGKSQGRSQRRRQHPRGDSALRIFTCSRWLVRAPLGRCASRHTVPCRAVPCLAVSCCATLCPDVLCQSWDVGASCSCIALLSRLKLNYVMQSREAAYSLRDMLEVIHYGTVAQYCEPEPYISADTLVALRLPRTFCQTPSQLVIKLAEGANTVHLSHCLQSRTECVRDGEFPCLKSLCAHRSAGHRSLHRGRRKLCRECF